MVSSLAQQACDLKQGGVQVASFEVSHHSADDNRELALTKLKCLQVIPLSGVSIKQSTAENSQVDQDGFNKLEEIIVVYKRGDSKEMKEKILGIEDISDMEIYVLEVECLD